MADKKFYPSSKDAGNGEKFKMSGATYSPIKEGNFKGLLIVNAWNKSKGRGMITCTVSPYKGSKNYTSGSGNEYMTMIANVLFHKSGNEMLIPCSMNIQTKVIGLSKLGMCISPNGHGKTKSGKTAKGYFGRFSG